MHRKLFLGLTMLALSALPCLTGCAERNVTSTSPTAPDSSQLGSASPAVGGGALPPVTPGPAPTGWVTQESVLADLAKFMNLTSPPTVPVVREITPNEQNTVIPRCMTESGWTADANGNWSYPADQLNAFNLALYTCNARYPVKEVYLQPLTNSQLLFIRSYWVDTEVACLANLGYKIPEPPTEQTFLAQQDAIGHWSPSGELLKAMGRNADQSKVNAALTSCPEYPPAGQIVQH